MLWAEWRRDNYSGVDHQLMSSIFEVRSIMAEDDKVTPTRKGATVKKGTSVIELIKVRRRPNSRWDKEEDRRGRKNKMKRILKDYHTNMYGSY